MPFDDKGNYIFSSKNNPENKSYVSEYDCRVLAQCILEGVTTIQEFSENSGVPEKDIEIIVINCGEPADNQFIH